MSGETKLQILDALEHHKEGLHLRKLAKTVNGSFPNIRRFVQILGEEGVIKTEHQGNLLNIKLQDSQMTEAYLKMVHTSRLLDLEPKIQDAISEILKKIRAKPIITLLTKSGKGEKPGNSWDLVLIFQDLDSKEPIKKIASGILNEQKIKANPVIVDYQEFEKGFLDKENEFSRKIRDDSIIFIGIEYYYNLLWRFLR